MILTLTGPGLSIVGEGSMTEDPTGKGKDRRELDEMARLPSMVEGGIGGTPEPVIRHGPMNLHHSIIANLYRPFTNRTRP